MHVPHPDLVPAIRIDHAYFIPHEELQLQNLSHLVLINLSEIEPRREFPVEVEQMVDGSCSYIGALVHKVGQGAQVRERALCS